MNIINGKRLEDILDKGIENVAPIFNVPLSQRDYVWKKDVALDFYNSLSDGPIFLGTIILKQDDLMSNQNEFVIFDGQQRITTIFLIYLIFKKNLIDLRENYSDEEYLKEIDSYINRLDRLIKYQRPFSEEIEIRIKYDSSIRNNQWRKIIHYFEKSEKLDFKDNLKNRAISLEKDINIKLDKISNYDEKIKIIFKIINQIEKSIFNYVILKNGDSLKTDEYEVFEILNAKGTKLTLWDLFKNYWFKILNESNQEKGNVNKIIEEMNSFIPSESKNQNLFIKSFPVIYLGHSYKEKFKFGDIDKTIKKYQNQNSASNMDFLKDISNKAKQFKNFINNIELFLDYLNESIDIEDRNTILNLIWIIRKNKYEELEKFLFGLLMGEKFDTKNPDNFKKIINLFSFLVIHQIFRTTIEKDKPNYINKNFYNSFIDSSEDFDKYIENIYDYFNINKTISDLEKLLNSEEYLEYQKERIGSKIGILFFFLDFYKTKKNLFTVSEDSIKEFSNDTNFETILEKMKSLLKEISNFNDDQIYETQYNGIKDLFNELILILNNLRKDIY